MSSEMRELIAKWRDTADQCEERGLEACSIGLTVAANKADARADELRGCANELEALLARTEAGADGGAPICLFDATNPCDGTCGECHHLHASPKDAAPVADGAVAFRWKSGGTANKPRWVYAEAGSKSIPPVGAHPLFTHPQDASGDAEEVICEHSGCGHGPQANQVPVTLWPGDKVLMRRGRLGAAMQAKEAK